MRTLKHRKFVVGTSLAVAIAGSMLIGVPAANAVDQVDSEWRVYKPYSVSIDHNAALATLAVADDTVVKLDNGRRAYRSYRVRVVGEKAHKVYFSERLSPWKARFALSSFSSGRVLSPQAVDKDYRPSSTLASVAAIKNHMAVSSPSTLEAEDKAFFAARSDEDAFVYGGEAFDDRTVIGAHALYVTVRTWWRNHQTAKDYSTYTGQRTSTDSAGITYVVGGTPPNFSVTAKVADGRWMRLTQKRRGGLWDLIESASSNSASGSSYWGYISKHEVAPATEARKRPPTS